MPRRPEQIGVNQARVLATLILSDPVALPETRLLRLGDRSGDLTQGAKVLDSLAARGLITRAPAHPRQHRDAGTRWVATPAAWRALAWFWERWRGHGRTRERCAAR